MPHLTVEDVLADLARAADLPVGEVARDEPMAELGVDSVRLMALVERWRAAGRDVPFPEVLAARTVEDALRALRLLP